MTYTQQEQEILSRYFTNVHGKVFALVNLPEHTKGALFARYSRSNKSLRRLFLDEFYRGHQHHNTADVGSTRAEELYNKVFVGYGDDSVAQLGGAHVAIEGISQICIKIIQRSRLMSFLEQSTRYVPYGTDQYHHEHGLGEEAEESIQACMSTYRLVLQEMTDWFSADGGKRGARAKALDCARGLLPAACTSNLGIYGSGQAYETLLHRLFASDLEEAQEVGRLLLCELKKVIPSFVKRVQLPDRGQRTIKHLWDRQVACRRSADVLFGGVRGNQGEPTVRLVDFDEAGEDKILAAILYEHAHVGSARIQERVAQTSFAAKQELFRHHAGVRTNRRHKPGRAFEEASYTFELCTSYGAFRDLQRHRMCTIMWQQLDTSLGYVEPPELTGELRDRFCDAMRQADKVYQTLPSALSAQYVVPLAYKIRYRVNINARALCHLLELRTQPGGHQEYIDVCRQMHALLRSQAGHQHIADAMSFVRQA